MKLKFQISYLFLFLSLSCAARLIPVVDIVSKESKGIIVTVGKQNISFNKDDLYTPVYLTIANKTKKKIKIELKNFLMVDDNNNQFGSVSIDEIRKESKKESGRADNFSCPPACFPYQIPYGYSDRFTFPYNYSFNPAYPSYFYPYLSSDPFLYYKDRNNNFTIIPPGPYLGYPLPVFTKDADPLLLALRMEEIYPNFQTQGYIYFNQATRLAKNKVKLLVNFYGNPNEKPMEFEFFVK